MIQPICNSKKEGNAAAGILQVSGIQECIKTRSIAMNILRYIWRYVSNLESMSGCLLMV